MPVSGTAGNHVLRIEVFDAANAPLSHLNSKVVATNGTWTGVIPFAITDDVTDIRVHVTDVATSISADKTLTRYKTDMNGDGGVDVVDLLTLVATSAWSSATLASTSSATSTATAGGRC